jgi:hypothetical protein
MAIATVPRLPPIHPVFGVESWMWDNRAMLHRGRAWDYAMHRRVMHQTTVAGEGPTA